MIFLLMPYGLPWLGALMMTLVGKPQKQTKYLLATISFALTGIATLVVLILTWDDAVIGGFGMIAMALAALLSLGLSVHLILKSRYGPEKRAGFYALFLLLIGGVNSLALTPSIVLMILSWGAIIFATARLLWFGGIVNDVSADKEDRRRRNMDDFYDSR